MNGDFIEALNEIIKEKDLSKDVLFEAIEAALLSAYKKNFGTSQNIVVDIDKITGKVKVFTKKKVVDNVANIYTEVSLDEAKKVNVNNETGDIIEIEVTPKEFGRIAAQTAKQVVVQRIREAERGVIYNKYLEKEDDIITGIVQRVEKNNVYIDLGNTEAILLPSEKIPGEIYKVNERIKLYITQVKKTNKGPQIIVSRTHPGLIKRLFELEVPEIHDGTIEVKGISREPGSRTKIAVSADNENVDAVGACVGPRGARVQAIVNELRGEKIDIIKWSEDPAEYIASSLSPAKILSVQVNTENKSAEVAVMNYQLSLAIGKEGQNARLAAKLTGWKIDIKSQTQPDEFLNDMDSMNE